MRRVFNLGIIDVAQIPDMNDESVMSDEWLLYFRNGIMAAVRGDGTIMWAC